MFFKNRINLSTQKYITAVDSLSMVTIFLCQFKYIGLLDITYKIPIFKIQSTVASTFWKFKTNENIFVGLAGAAVGAAAGAGAAKVLPGKHDTKVLDLSLLEIFQYQHWIRVSESRSCWCRSRIRRWSISEKTGWKKEKEQKINFYRYFQFLIAYIRF